MSDPTPQQKLALADVDTAFSAFKCECREAGALTTYNNAETVHVAARIAIKKGLVTLPQKFTIGASSGQAMVGTSSPMVTLNPTIAAILQIVLGVLETMFAANPTLTGVLAEIQSLLALLYPAA